MKGLLLLAGVVAAVAALLYLRRTPSSPRAAPQPVQSAMAGLRDQILHGSAQKFGVTPVGEVWGVVMDIGFPTATVTVFGLADGNASLYISTGGGVLGGVAFESVRVAAKRFCEVGQRMHESAHATNEFPVPARGGVRFYLLTTSGVRVAEATQAELEQGKHTLTPLYAAGQDVITQLRLVSEQPR